MTHKEVIAALRSAPSRSKRELFDTAADMIERLVECLKLCDLDCTFCKEGVTPAPCENSDFDCEACVADCPCRDCSYNSNWVWKEDA